MLKKLKQKFDQIIEAILSNNQQKLDDVNEYLLDYRAECLNCDVAPPVSDWKEKYRRLRPPKDHVNCRNCKKSSV